jgi:hypothetical protein
MRTDRSDTSRFVEPWIEAPSIGGLSLALAGEGPNPLASASGGRQLGPSIARMGLKA